MKQKSPTHSLITFFFFTVQLAFAGCQVINDPKEKNPCDRDYETASLDADVAPGGSYYLEAPPGENDCHATYAFDFRWKDDFMALTDESMPPIKGLEHGFGPAGEFSYFPHAAPTRVKKSDGTNIWTITFSAGNKNTGYPSTEHSIGVSVPTTQEDPGAQTLAIRGVIRYVPYQKPE